jgi:hypothetical protein
LGNTPSLPNGGNKQARASKRPPGLGGGNELRPVVGFVTKTLIICQDPPKLRIVTLALVDQHPDELRLDKLMVPLPGRSDTFP